MCYRRCLPQFHEHTAQSNKDAYLTVRDARSGLVNEALIIFCVMLLSIFIAGEAE